MIKRILIFLLMMNLFLTFIALCVFAAQSPTTKETHNGKKNGGDASIQEERPTTERPVLTIKPRELDFGDIRPGEGVKGSFELKNVGAGALRWWTTGPTGWISLEKQKLAGDLELHQGSLNLHLSCLDVNLPGNRANKSTSTIQLIMESTNRRVVYQKDVAAGTYRETIPMLSNGGTRTIFFRFRTMNGRSEPAIQVEPLKIDFGTLNSGDKITRHIHLNNKGVEPLKWRIEPQKKSDVSSSYSKKGRYISFFNDDIKGKGTYEEASHLKENLETLGSWSEHAGFPEAGEGNSLKYRFSGSGIAILFWKYPSCEKLNVLIDDKLMNEIDCFSEQHELSESIVAEGLMDMPHTLTLVNVGGRAIIDGVSIYGREVKTGPPGTIHIFPDSGVTKKETDYINVSVNTERLGPGWYGDEMIIRSTGGDVNLELSFEISADDIPKIVDVYRYTKDGDYVYLTNPQIEAKRLEPFGYRKEGIAFRLFRAGTPGTVSFYRWYNPKKRDHFYSYDITGGGKSLSGYVFEGIIGSIATSKLTNTRGLYRWYHVVKGTHFYTTDQNGEGQGKKGYRFEAIAGYVR